MLWQCRCTHPGCFDFVNAWRHRAFTALRMTALTVRTLAAFRSRFMHFTAVPRHARHRRPFTKFANSSDRENW
jgi:hypothetical protein